MNGDQPCLNVVFPPLPGTDIICNATRWFIPAFSPHPAVLFSPQSLRLMYTGKPTGVAVSHCTTRFQTALILTTCQILLQSTALNLDSEMLSRVPDDEQDTPAHLGLDQKKN